MFSLFSSTDRIELALAIAILVFALTWKRWLQGPLAAFARKTVWCMIALAILPVGLRLLLLPNYPIPTPNVGRRFQLRPVGRHARHFRLANPPHSLPSIFRDVVCHSTAELQLDVSARDRACAGAGLGVVRKSLGRSRSFDWGSLRADLLDAARLDHGCVGAGGRRACRDRVRPSQSMDE